MSGFRVKGRDKRTKTIERRVTLDAKHNQLMKNMNLEAKQLKKVKSELKKYCVKLKKIRSDLKSIEEDELNDLYIDESIKKDLIQQKIEIKDKIRENKKFIHDVDNNKKFDEYFLKTFDVLNEYYNDTDTIDPNDNKKAIPNDVDKNINSNENLNNNQNLNQNSNQNSNQNLNQNSDQINNYFNNLKYKSLAEIKNINEEQSRNNNRTNRRTIVNFNNNNKTYGDKSNSKSALLDNYNKIIDPTAYKPPVQTINYTDCRICGKERVTIPSEGTIVCERCGITEQILIDNDKPSYKDPPPENASFAYKRINHLNECLAQLQAKESTEIPEEVFNTVVIEIKKNRIKDMNKLTNERMRDFLKKHGFNKYYEHIPYIKHRITKIPPPEMSKDLEDKIRKMFCEAQIPYNEIKTSERKNFLSYSYTVHKIVEILGRHDLKKFLPLLRNRNKLAEQDKMWQRICEVNGWPFRRSV
jgi:hypothetical protein